jgi:hypothetical protein
VTAKRLLEGSAIEGDGEGDGAASRPDAGTCTRGCLLAEEQPASVSASAGNKGQLYRLAASIVLDVKVLTRPAIDLRTLCGGIPLANPG